MTQDSIIAFGIIGFGAHAERVMIKTFAEVPRARVTAIGTSSKDKQTAIAEVYPTVKIYGRYEDVLADSTIDAVYIALPNHLHAEWSLKALAAGKHVLCEKPLALSYQDALQVRETALKCKKKVVEAFMYRFHPQYREVKRLIQCGTIGDLRLVEVHYQYWFDDPKDIRLKSETGGGGWFDVGCYTVDCARFIFETEPERISGAWCLGPSGVDESASFQLVFPGNRVAHLTCGINLSRANRYSVYGTKGAIHVESAFHVPRTQAPVLVVEREGEKTQQIVIPAANHYALLIEGFINWISGAGQSKTLCDDGVENVRILEAGVIAAKTGREVSLGEVLLPNSGGCRE